MNPSVGARSLQPVPEPDSSDDCLSFSSDEEFEGVGAVGAIPPSSVLNRPASVWTSPNISPNTYLKTAFSKGDSGLMVPIGTKPLSFDAFLQVIDSMPQPTPSPRSSQFLKPTLPTPSPKPVAVSTYKAALQKAKELALAKEQLQLTRKSSATTLQTWWRRVRCRAAISRCLFYYRLAVGLRGIARKQWVRELAEGVVAANAARLQAAQLLLARYKDACAAAIQRYWRGYRQRKAAEEAVRRRATLLGFVKGWKTRRILKAWPVGDIVERMKEDGVEFRALLVMELVQTFREEYRSGKWMRPRRVNLRTRSRRVDNGASASSHSPVRITGLRLHSPNISTETMASTPNAKSTLDFPSTTLMPFPAKPFLKRKTQTIAMQKVNWASVKTKVNCWVAPETKVQIETEPARDSVAYARNSVEEFVAIERMSIRTETRARAPSKSLLRSKESGRSTSLPQHNIERKDITDKQGAEKDNKGNGDEAEMIRLSTIKSAEDSDEGDLNMFSTFDTAPTRQVRLKRQRKSSPRPSERNLSVGVDL